MATLTIPQIAQLAANVGIPNGEPMYTCCSIAMAESSGRTDATNQNDNGTTDRGLWQINDVHDDKMPGADRYDPEVNAQLMAQISSGGTNWQPWSTFNSGASLDHLGPVMEALGGTVLTPNGGAGAGSGAGNGLTYENAGFLDGAKDLTNKFGAGLDAIERFFRIITSVEGWIRILKVYVGAVLVVGGLVLVMVTTSTGKSAVSAAVTVLPGGKAVKTVARQGVKATAAKAATKAVTGK